jgi:uncharacterized protein DUF4440
MNGKSQLLWISLFGIVLFTALGVIRAQTGGNADAVAAITKLENDSVKADLAGDSAFYQKVLAEDWTGGDSDGMWFTKADAMKMMADTQHNNTKSETLSDLKVRVYGNAAVATYKDTYDGMTMGQHRARSVIATDTFAKMGGEWRLVASHSCVAK